MSSVDIRFYAAVLVRRLPIVIAAFLACALLGLVVAVVMPAMYRGSARILVEAPQIDSGVARGPSSSDAFAQLQAIEQQIVSRTSLLALAERFDVYQGKPARSLDDIVDDMRSRLKIAEIQFAGTGSGASATAFSVMFDAQEPVLAADVANEIATRIVNRNVEMRTGRASDTFRFFDGEVDRLGKTLSEMEARLLRFTNENRESLPDSLEFRRERQASQQERLVQLQREEAELRNRRGNLIKTAEDSGRGQLVDARSPREQKLAELQQLLEARREVFAQSSPSVTAVEARIDALQKRDATVDAGDPSLGRPTSELGMQLADIDGRLAFIAQERSTIGDELVALAKSIQTTPNNAAVLNALNRDYDNVRSQYNAATRSRADASSVEQIELLSKGQKLTIIESASPPTYPTKPRRKLIVALGALGGIAVGLGIVFLMEISNRTVRRPLELTNTLGIAPFATIPYIPTPREGLRRRLSLAAVIICAVTVPVAVWSATEWYPQHVDQFFGAVLNTFRVV